MLVNEIQHYLLNISRIQRTPIVTLINFNLDYTSILYNLSFLKFILPKYIVLSLDNSLQHHKFFFTTRNIDTRITCDEINSLKKYYRFIFDSFWAKYERVFGWKLYLYVIEFEVFTIIYLWCNKCYHCVARENSRKKF